MSDQEVVVTSEAPISAEPAVEVAEVTEQVEQVEQVEAVVEELRAPAPVEVDMSAKFAEIRRAERKLRNDRNSMEASRADEKAKWVSDLKSNPIAMLQEMGINADVLASALLGGDAPVEQAEQFQKLDPKIQSRLDELDQYKNDQLAAKFRKGVFDAVEKSPEDYELLLSSDAGRDNYLNAVMSYITEYGEVPDYDDIAKTVEDTLFEEGKRILGLGKMRALNKPVAEKPIEPSKFKTLSNSVTPTSLGQRASVKVSPVTSQTRGITSDYQSYMESRKQKLIDNLK